MLDYPARFSPLAATVGSWRALAGQRSAFSAFTHAANASLPAFFDVPSQNVTLSAKLDGMPLARPDAVRLHARREAGALRLRFPSLLRSRLQYVEPAWEIA